MKVLAKAFTLPDVQVGSIIEYFYTIDFKEHYFFESHWILSQDDLFTKSAKFSLKPYARYNNRMAARWSWQNLPRELHHLKRDQTTLSGWKPAISPRFRPKTLCRHSVVVASVRLERELGA